MPPPSKRRAFPDKYVWTYEDVIKFGGFEALGRLRDEAKRSGATEEDDVN